MDKPSSMSVKEHIYRKLSQELDFPLATVKKVLDNQFRTALSALKDNNSLEIAGFGKIIINKNRLKNHIETLKKSIPFFQAELAKPTLDPLVREKYQNQLDRVPKELEVLNVRMKKLNLQELKRNEKRDKSKRV